MKLAAKIILNIRLITANVLYQGSKLQVVTAGAIAGVVSRCTLTVIISLKCL